MLLSLLLLSHFFYILSILKSNLYTVRSKKPNNYSPLVNNLSEEKRKSGDGVVGVGKRLRLKDKDVILKKSALEKNEENKEDEKASEKEKEKSMNMEEEKTEHNEEEKGVGGNTELEVEKIGAEDV